MLRVATSEISSLEDRYFVDERIDEKWCPIEREIWSDIQQQVAYIELLVREVTSAQSQQVRSLRIRAVVAVR